jgi:hypothetical protein
MGIDLPSIAEEFCQQVNRIKSKIGCPFSGSYKMWTSDVCEANIFWAPIEVRVRHNCGWNRNGLNNVGRDYSYPSRGCERSAVRSSALNLLTSVDNICVAVSAPKIGSKRPVHLYKKYR